MKRLLFVLLLIPFVGFGQGWLSSSNYPIASSFKSVSSDSSKSKICKERGHVSPEYVESTLAYCQPYLIETDSSTIRVYPGCNSIRYTCERCKQYIVEQEKEIRIVLWRKEKKCFVSDSLKKK